MFLVSHLPCNAAYRTSKPVVTHPIEISRVIRVFVNTGFAVPIIRSAPNKLAMVRALNVVARVIGSLALTSSMMIDIISLRPTSKGFIHIEKILAP